MLRWSIDWMRFYQSLSVRSPCSSVADCRANWPLWEVRCTGTQFNVVLSVRLFVCPSFLLRGNYSNQPAAVLWRYGVRLWFMELWRNTARTDQYGRIRQTVEEMLFYHFLFLSIYLFTCFKLRQFFAAKRVPWAMLNTLRVTCFQTMRFFFSIDIMLLTYS